MARTKQTARKSTGGKVPLKLLPPPQQQQQQQQQQQNLKVADDEEEEEEDVDDENYLSDSSAPNDEEEDELGAASSGRFKKMKKLDLFSNIAKQSGKRGRAQTDPAKSKMKISPFTLQSDMEGVPMLQRVIAPSMLQERKKGLKSITEQKPFNPATLSRKDFMTNLTFSSYRFLPLAQALDFLKTQAMSTDLTVLALGGMEQLTDAFLYMIYDKQINFHCLETVSLDGCYRITDAGIKWLTSALPKLDEINLVGCKNLTEVSLHLIIDKWKTSLKSINMSGTNVGILPEYSGSLRLKGCPLISPTEAVYKDATLEIQKNRPQFNQTALKMVILTEDNLPWSPLAVMTKEKDITPRKRLSVKTDWSLSLDKTYQVNVFEAPLENGFYELLLSEGCIVVLPYLLAEDGPDQDYADHICYNLTKIFSKCPDCLFILLGLSEEKGLTKIADRYKNMITQQFKRRGDDLDKELIFSTERNSYINLMAFGDQLKFAHGEILREQCEVVVGSKLITSKKSKNKTDLLLSAVLHVGGNVDGPVKDLLTKAVADLKHHYPWYFTSHQQELNEAIKGLDQNRFSLCQFDDWFNTGVTQQIKQSFHDTNAYPHMGKVLQTMRQMGKALHFPFISGTPILTDFTVLETIYEKLMTQPAPSKATWQFLGSSFPCWTTEDLLSICGGSRETVEILVKLFERFGLLLKLPRDHWTKELGDATCAYVLFKNLPMYPATDIENFWPDAVPDDEIQNERYFSFHPGIPDSFFPNVIRYCSQLGGLRLLWNRGVIIQKGPAMILLELLSSYENTPMLYLGVRMLRTSQLQTDSPQQSVLDSTRRIYQSVVRSLIVDYKIYAVESIQCVTCLPSRNRYKTVNSRSSEIWLMRELILKQHRTTGRQVTCKNDGSLIDLDAALGHHGAPLNLINPCHTYLGCLPSFSSYNRCMLCQSCAFDGQECKGNLDNGTTAWNCSCNREAQMCDKCGVCQRCVIFLTKLETNLSPYFREQDGSCVSLVPDVPYSVDQELTPNYCPLLEVVPVRGSFLQLAIKIGSSKLLYDSAASTLKLISAGNQEKDCNPNGFSLITKEGSSISVELKFLKSDLDEMEIILRLRGFMVYTHRCSTQSCPVTLTAKNPMFVVIALPKQKKLRDLGIDELGERATCSGSKSVAGFEASLVAGKRFAETALFQAGGVNFSGSSMVTLPKNLSMHHFQFPSYQIIKKDNVYHPLCYTRTKISDVMTFSGTAAIPESWSVYRMVHFLDSQGFSIEPKTELVIADKAYPLLWAWHFFMVLLPKVTLPREVTELLPAGLLTKDSQKQVEAGLFELLKMEYWRIVLHVDLENLLPMFEDQYALSQQSKILADVLEQHYEETGMIRTVSKFNDENILYLCEGHYASLRVEEGLTKVLPEIYGIYSLYLMSIDMPANQIKEIPEDMFKVLPNLTEFDCSSNYIEVLPASIGNCKKLYSLSLRENNLHDLPETLTDCKDLFRLDIASNAMMEIPAIVTKLTWLNRLYASHMMLTSLPEDIGNLVNLDKLLINGNCFTKLPASFTKLKNLEELSMSGVPWFGVSKTRKVVPYDMFINFLKTRNIDRWLEAHDEDRKEMFQFFDEDSNGTLDLRELGKLNAAIFNIFPRFGYKGTEPPDDDMPSGFPMELLECTSLQHLDLYYQGFVSVPPEISKLQELRFLNLSHNPNLLSVPAELGLVTSLTKLELEECPLLKTPPKEIRVKGFSTTFAYLQRLMSGSMQCKRTKLMLVGLGGAGKTSLVKALLSDNNKTDFTQGEQITDGIDISTWTVSAGDENITYSVWDFAGQTVYYNTHQFFLSNRAVYLLLWNMRLGFEHAGLDFWLSSVSVQAPKAPIFVVGSHVDQVSKYDFPINEMRQRYKQIAGFHFVSSYTGQGIDELKEQLFEATLQEEYIGEQIPEVWLRFENMVIESRSSCDVIEYSALEKMANMSGIFDKTEVHQAVQFLHDLGSLQHFTTESLKTKVVVNPQWIVDVMACVVSVKNSPIREGRLKHKDIALVWKDYPQDLHNWLLKLTEEYDLTFPLENEPVNLVPCLLPEEPPQFKWPEVEKDSDVKENKMIYKFDYLPAGLFNRGQVRLHQISDASLIWKKGSFLKKNGHIALILQHRDSELVVTVQGPRPENVIFLVHEVFEGLISESFRGVTYDYLMPCPDCLEQGLRDPHMFAASTVRRAVSLKAPFLQCVKYFHTISCVDLLAFMPPDNHSDFDLHLVQSVRSLRDLRKDLSADLFMSYCVKDAPASRSSVIHPATVRDDLEKLGYKCWFQETTKTYAVDEMARAMIDSEVFVVFISVDYAKDEDCTNMFKYARLTLRKPMVVIAVGDGYEWKQSKLGILLSDVVFVNMTNAKKPNYQTKFEELLKALNEKTKKSIGTAPTPSCFFSYSWVNSAQAVSLGTRSIPGAIGYGDPREIKRYVEDHGVKCWIDVERVGQNGLIDDISEGLLSAKVVVVCVSDEYANSEACRMEFHYAVKSLKLPIIMAVVGKGNRWRASEIGVLSSNYPLVSFQEKSETAYETLLNYIKEELGKQSGPSEKEMKNKQNQEHKNLSFQELFELAQRKLLRQLCFYAEHQDAGVYPRLFVADFAKSRTSKKEKPDEEDSEKKRPLSRMMSQDGHTLSKKLSDVKAAFKMQRFCVHILCEHDEGWHSVADPLPLPDDFGHAYIETFSPFLARMTAVMKYNKQMKFQYLQEELGQDYLKWLEESPQAMVSDYQGVYHDFRKMVIEADLYRKMGSLMRCRLPNGKTIWLCERHRNSMRVTVLSTEAAVSDKQIDTDSGTSNFLIEGLRELDHKTYSGKFKSTRKSLRRKDSSITAKVESLPNLPDPSKKVKHKKAKQTIQEKTDEMEKLDKGQDKGSTKSSTSDTANHSAVVPGNKSEVKSDQQSAQKEVQSQSVMMKVKSQSSEDRKDSQPNGENKTESQSLVKVKTQSTSGQTETGKMVFQTAETERNQRPIESKEKEVVSKKESSEGLRSSRVSLTDAATGRNAQRQLSAAAIPKLDRSASQSQKPKSKLCVIM